MPNKLSSNVCFQNLQIKMGTESDPYPGAIRMRTRLSQPRGEKVRLGTCTHTGTTWQVDHLPHQSEADSLDAVDGG